jgi:hypothetical protein
VVGDNVVVCPTQMLVAPVMLTTGSAFTVTAPVVAVQLVVPSVNVNVAVPADMPVTSPELFTVATGGLLLAHVPPVVGDNVVVCPTQMLVAPVMLTTGGAFTTSTTTLLVSLHAIGLVIVYTLR